MSKDPPGELVASYTDIEYIISTRLTWRLQGCSYAEPVISFRDHYPGNSLSAPVTIDQPLDWGVDVFCGDIWMHAQVLWFNVQKQPCHRSINLATEESRCRSNPEQALWLYACWWLESMLAMWKWSFPWSSLSHSVREQEDFLCVFSSVVILATCDMCTSSWFSGLNPGAMGQRSLQYNMQEAAACSMHWAFAESIQGPVLLWNPG